MPMAVVVPPWPRARRARTRPWLRSREPLPVGRVPRARLPLPLLATATVLPTAALLAA